MSLPMPWVDKIFTKLTLTYGRNFASQYEGLDTAAVKADWAHELDGYDKHPEAIAFALKNLPADRPPNVLQFRALARRSPPPQREALPRPEMDEQGKQRVRAMLDELRTRITATPSRGR